METLYIKPQELEKGFIGGGDEGCVYRYNNQYAVKIFNSYYDKEKRMENKMAKVKELMKIQDPSFAFPMGLVTTNGKTENGYYTKYIAGRRSFRHLSLEMNREKILKVLLEAEAALKRIHKRGIIVGDLKEENILLNRGNHPVFIDTDNYICGKHPFDLLPLRVGCLYDLYGGKMIRFEDNDKLLFALMSLEMLTKDPRFKYGASREDIAQAIKTYSKNKEVREVLSAIFSNAEEKPYVGSVLQKVI
ncbi:MAG: serine/threonine protein kinase [Bacilli bacterium]|nr:serine/threonine protein kinase [Bacilli bacterium]